MKIKKIVCVFLAALLTLLMITSCNNSSEQNSGSKGAKENGDLAESGEANISDEIIIDEKPEDPFENAPELPVIDMNGRIFNLATLTSIRNYDQFCAEEQNGDLINDALYIRNIRVEEKYNIKINQIDMADSTGLTNALRRSIQSADGAYDFSVGQMRSMSVLANEGLLYDWHTVPYVQDGMKFKWWEQNMIREMSINGKLYLTSGNILIKDDLRVFVMYFNKDMFQELGLEFPYQSVRDGTWTIDKLLSLTKDVNHDLNGDGVIDQFDQWGVMSEYTIAQQLFNSAGEMSIVLDNDGQPQITVDTPRGIQILEKVLSIATDGTSMFMADSIKGAADVWQEASKYFQENRFAIRTSVLEPVVRDLRAMETQFGILPAVKFDEKQERYYTQVNQWGYCVVLPQTADAELVGLVLENLARESLDTLTPAFYELSLRSKVLRDDESEEMLDIILDTKLYDIGVLYGLGGIDTAITGMVTAGNTNFVSELEKIKDRVQNDITAFMKNYQ